jgi:hypothetical protein
MTRDRTQRVVEGEIACVEFHDARVDAFVVQMDDRSVIHFAHLPVYHQLAAEKFELWSYRARIELIGVQRVVVDGRAGDADYISDAVGFDDNGLVNSGRIPVDKPIPLSRIGLQFGSGRIAEITCSAMRLMLEEALEYVEDWIGPL